MGATTEETGTEDTGKVEDTGMADDTIGMKEIVGTKCHAAHQFSRATGKS